MTEEEKVNILLVDDQPGKLLSYEIILASLGERLFKANSARQALEILLKNDIAVVLADVCMPEFDGFELAAMLREHPRYASTAVIFISAVHLSEEDRARGFKLGAVDYVSVPIVPEILRAKVKIFVDLYRRTRELEQLNVQLEQRVHDRTLELQEANSRLKESEERLRLASEAAGFGTYDYNAAADRIHCSPHLKRLLGADIEGEMSLAAFLNLVHEEHRNAVRDAMLHANTQKAAQHEIEFRSSVSPGRWLLDRGRSFEVGRSAEIPVVRTLGTILDITGRKQLEERQKLLIAELDHRVKNVLANVKAMARLSGTRAGSITEFVGALEGRLHSMANAHSLLSQGDWSSAELSELAGLVLAPFRSSREDNIVFEGGPLRLRPKVVQDLALVLHELATNAVKHGALTCAEGKVRLSWLEDPVQRVTRVTWIETNGPKVFVPKKRGLGLSIIQSAFSSSNTLINCEFAESGLVCTIQGALAESWQSPNGVAPVEAKPPALTRLNQKPVVSRPLRVLLVEDELLLAMHLQTELEKEGHTVVGPASDVAGGLAIAQTVDLDVALLDINLGRETSADIAAALISRGIPFAFATGYSDVNVLPVHFREHPRVGKPYVIDEIRRLIDELAGDEPEAKPQDRSSRLSASAGDRLLR